MTSTTSSADIPDETLDNLVDLVGTGPVLLGAYTLAEIDAVGAIDHLFEAKPSPELIAEAVRSLAARGLISTDSGSEALKVIGLRTRTTWSGNSARSPPVPATPSAPQAPVAWRDGAGLICASMARSAPAESDAGAQEMRPAMRAIRGFWRAAASRRRPSDADNR